MTRGHHYYFHPKTMRHHMSPPSRFLLLFYDRKVKQATNDGTVCLKPFHPGIPAPGPVKSSRLI